MADPVIRNPEDRSAVMHFIDRRIARYQLQRKQAEQRDDRYANKVGMILINELLDLRNELTGVPGANLMGRRPWKAPTE